MGIFSDVCKFLLSFCFVLLSTIRLPLKIFLKRALMHFLVFLFWWTHFKTCINLFTDAFFIVYSDFFLFSLLQNLALSHQVFFFFYSNISKFSFLRSFLLYFVTKVIFIYFRFTIIFHYKWMFFKNINSKK